MTSTEARRPFRTFTAALVALSCLALAPTVAGAATTAGATDREPKPTDRDRDPIVVTTADRAELREFRDAIDARRGSTGERGSTAPQGAAAAEAGAPVITAPTSGASLGGIIQVAATSTAPYVRFTSGGWSSTVATSGDSAATTLDAFGRQGAQTITAVPCDDAAGTTCADTPGSVDFTVANAPITIVQPVTGSTVGTSFVAGTDNTGGGVHFHLDGIPGAGFASGEPYQATIDTTGISEGSHTLTAHLCNAALTECNGGVSAAVSVTVDRALAPSIQSVSPSPFSPNGDGRNDTTQVLYTLDVDQEVTWRVTDGFGTTLRSPVELGPQTAGPHSFLYDGTVDGGGKLPSGDYVLHLETVKAITDGSITGMAEDSFQVDLLAPTVTNRTASPATFYPVKDNYRDTTSLRGTLSEQATALRVEIFTSGGTKVRTLTLGPRAAGPVSVAWNGRNAAGTLLREGTYGFRFVARDVAGNEKPTSKTSVVLSHKKLVPFTETRTVSAQGSFTGVGIVGFCSDVFKSTYWPSAGIAYLSDYYADDYSCSAEDGDDVAFLLHRLVLPSAIRYGAVRVEGYGKRDLPGYPDRGLLIYQDKAGELTDRGGVLGAAEGWYAAETVSGANFVDGRVLRWWAGTVAFNWYDIKSFRVRYTYFLLR